MMWRIRKYLARKLLGESHSASVEDEVQAVYALIWPKHNHYEEQTLKLLRQAITRARLHK